jgi:hypothetical protein
MALQLGALRDALEAAGADPAKARAAAEAVLTWMAATNLVVTLGVLWRVLAL